MTATKSWGDAKKPESNERKDIERLKIDKGGEKKVRLIGEVLPRYVRWVTTTEGKKFPVESLSFNRESEQFEDSANDPFNEIPKEVYDEKAQFSYVCNVIDRQDNNIKLFDIKRTVYSQIVDLALNAEYGNPSDEKTGYDITVKKESTGSLPQNVKYACLPGRNSTPLSEEELELELYDLTSIYKRPTYDDQKQWLVKNTTFFENLGGSETKVESAEDL